MSIADSGKASWFKAVRSAVAGELIRANKNAFVLLYVIAARARWKTGFNAHGLAQGESFIGDHDAYGLSEQEYRTAKALLAKHGFATFKPTTSGTIATIATADVFEICPEASNGQTNAPLTDSQRTANGRSTTNKKGEKGSMIDSSERGPKPQTARTTRL